MSHADVVEAIGLLGGRLVASFTLDADGRTVGAASTHNSRTRCSVCHEHGHTAPRCNGAGVAPRPPYQERRKR